MKYLYRANIKKNSVSNSMSALLLSVYKNEPQTISPFFILTSVSLPMIS